METNQIIQKALAKLGLSSQLQMAQEEPAELIVAISHYIRNPSEPNAKAVIEEMADTELVLESLKLIFNDHAELFIQIKEHKLNRLQSLLWEL